MTTETMDTCKDTACTQTKRYTARPRARVYETDEQYSLDIEMPGVSESDTEITLHKNELTIVGDADGLEFRYERRFKLPATIDATSVSASMQFGILKLVLPKAEDAKPRTIKVIAG